MSGPASNGDPDVVHVSRAQRALDRWAREYPDRAGFIGADGRELTWRQTAVAVRTLAGRLRDAGAGAGDRVAVMAGRSRHGLAALLAVRANGSSAVLLDERHPVERLRWTVRDAGCVALVSSEPEAAAVGLPVIGTTGSETTADVSPPDGPGDRPWARTEPGAEAYVVYTSGTTGRPKGVRIGSAALENLLAGAETLGYRPGSRAVCVVSPGFDGWLWSVLTPFVNGVTSVVIDTAAGNVEQALADRYIDNLCMTPTLYAAIEKLPAVEVAVVAGERCPDALVARLRERADRVINVYGPTEATIAATMADTARGDDPRTIGRPLPGYTVTVVDGDLGEVAPGTTGEVLIGGAGVALGYVGAAADTDRFVELGGVRHFRTGDLGTLRADGQLECLGRMDNQVKVGGFRTELEEIESIACEVPGVDRAVAYLRGDPPTLAVAVRTAPGTGLDDGLRRRLAAAFAARLPRQLCPTFTHRIAEVPLEPTGKVARREVAALGDAEQAGPGGTRSGPAGGVLDGVLDAWSGVFGQSVAEDADFFAIGGHSLLAAQLASRIEAHLGITVSITDVLTTRTPGALALRIEEMRQA
ncbi:non-ribosomal peptide synthetase [Streptomyces pactum]|uniref:Non-ribosomal peptide synthetase n=1 Tax=Streptomyces pactum TaxID=68249 RepID=A0ABS0NRD1_9ACTN|nr:non-ribosomal peptide synthetase [Streptomyces pactum]MBH5337780.1 non-ribosomal peptide synthetase [Streptomyces pactum]